MSKIDGPRLEPEGAAPSALVVLLHGYGSNGDDLIALGAQWRNLLPDAVFVAPNAPLPLDPTFDGYQWFEISFRDPGEFWRGVQAAGPQLDAFIDDELIRYRLGGDRLLLVGFSQGTMMALHCGLRREIAPAGIIAYSGRLAGSEHLGSQIRCRPPVLVVHGEQDDIIPVDALYATRDILAAQGVPVQWHVSPGLGHGIDRAGLEIGARFAVSALNGVVPEGR